jgi:hypothetical protein
MIRRKHGIMAPQMESNQPIHEQPSAAYGAYEGTRESYHQQYETKYQQPTLDDNFVEAVAQRIAQHMHQDTTGKVREKGDRLSPEQRTGIAIVSIIFSLLPLIPLGIVLGQRGFDGLIALGVVCLTIFLVNAVIHSMLSSGK